LALIQVKRAHSMSQLGPFAAGSAETACPQMSALHQYRPQILVLGFVAMRHYATLSPLRLA
jgi:hypothetical protein